MEPDTKSTIFGIGGFGNGAKSAVIGAGVTSGMVEAEEGACLRLGLQSGSSFLSSSSKHSSLGMTSWTSWTTGVYGFSS